MNQPFIHSVKFPSPQEMHSIQREAEIMRAQFLRSLLRRVFSAR